MVPRCLTTAVSNSRPLRAVDLFPGAGEADDALVQEVEPVTEHLGRVTLRVGRDKHDADP